MTEQEKPNDDALVEAMCEAAAEHPEWANQSQMEAALSAIRPTIQREEREKVLREYMRWLNRKAVYGVSVIEFAKEAYGLSLSDDTKDGDK